VVFKLIFNKLTTLKLKRRAKKQSADQVVKEIKRRTLQTFTAEEKIKIVLEAMHGEDTIAAIGCK
jgi:transposase